MKRLERRIVWPAILCIIGTIPILGFIMLIFPAYLSNLADLILVVPGLLAPAFWLLTVGVLLLLEPTYRKVWGILATVSFALSSILSVFAFFQLFSGQSIGSIDSLISVPLFAGPLIGLVGAVWGLLWKPRPRATSILIRVSG